MRMFISHKSIDQNIADRIANKIEVLSANQIEVFISERIEQGTEWFQVIKNQLQTSDLLLLIYTDPQEVWDWCMYEAGFFEGHNRAKLITLHPANIQPPFPLRQYQSVPVDTDNVRTFVGNLLFEYNPSLEGSEDFDVFVELIVNLFEQIANVKVREHVKTLVIRLNKEQKDFLIKNISLSENVIITGRESVFRVFNLQDPDDEVYTIKRLIDQFGEAHKAIWYREFCRTLSRLVNNETVQPVLPAFFRNEGVLSPSYRPVITKTKRYSTGDIEIEIVFFKRPILPDSYHSGDLGLLANLMHLARYTLINVVNRFLPIIENSICDNADSNEIKVILTDMTAEYSRIHRAGTNMNITSANLIKDCFKSDNRNEVSGFIENWISVSSNLREAMEHHSLEEIKSCLLEFKSGIPKFLELCANRYMDLIQRI